MYLFMLRAYTDETKVQKLSINNSTYFEHTKDSGKKILNHTLPNQFSCYRLARIIKRFPTYYNSIFRNKRYLLH